MPKFLDLTGKKFGKLTVINQAERIKERISWNCQCDCGKSKIIVAASLRAGQSKSCGCFHKERLKGNKFAIRHGMACKGNFHPSYSLWASMKARCSNKNDINYHNYGGRGISFCERWKSFENFVIDMGNRPPKYTLERVDNNGNYCPENCIWTTTMAQSTNKRMSLWVKFLGADMSLRDFALLIDQQYSTVNKRVQKLGWSTEKIAANPPNRKKKGKL